MADLHPQAPTGSQLQIGARHARAHFVPGGDLIYFRRAKSASGFQAKRPRVRNENLDPSRQTIPGVNVEASLEAIKFDLMPDVDSMVPFRACHNGAYHVGAQLGATAGTGTVTTNGTTAIVGAGTAFTTQLSVGDWLSIVGEAVPRQVASIADATNLVLAVAATTSGAGKAFTFASVTVFPWSFHPRLPTETAPATFVDSMDYEITDGDGYPVMDYEAQQQDLEIKISDGKIQEISETWMACYDTYASDATLVKAVSAYSAKPAIYGHFSTANALLLPLRIKITSVAGTGFDGKFKAAFDRPTTGTVETAGTTALVGTGTAFTTELTVGDALYITGEAAPRIITTITDDTNIVLAAAANTTASGLDFTAATFAGTAIPFTFDLAAEVTVGTAASLIGVSRFESVFLTWPAGNGTVSVDDEWSFTEPRTLAVPVYSRRDIMHAAGVQVTIDGAPYGGVPGKPGFHTVTIKLTIPKKANKTTGSKYAQGIYPNGRTSATISFDRDRSDRVFLNKLIQASSIAIIVNMYGNPFGDTGQDELWQFTFRTCEIADNTRDVATETVLPEKIDVNATRGPSRSLTGTVTTNGTVTITGAGTLFTDELAVGDEVQITGESVRTVATIASNTSLTLTAAATTSAAEKNVTAVAPIWSELIRATRATLTSPMA